VNSREFSGIPFFNASSSARPSSAASLPHVFRYLHGTEMRAAHGTEMRGLRAFLRQSFVMEFARGFGIAAEIELIFPRNSKRALLKALSRSCAPGWPFLSVAP
jgi:hypothetical protein